MTIIQNENYAANGYPLFVFEISNQIKWFSCRYHELYKRTKILLHIYTI